MAGAKEIDATLGGKFQAEAEAEAKAEDAPTGESG